MAVFDPELAQPLDIRGVLFPKIDDTGIPASQSRSYSSGGNAPPT